MSKQLNFAQLNVVHRLVLFDPQRGHYQVLRLRARVDQGAMAMKWYSSFPKLIPQSSPSDTFESYPGQTFGGILPLCKEAAGIFYNLIDWARAIIFSFGLIPTKKSWIPLAHRYGLNSTTRFFFLKDGLGSK